MEGANNTMNNVYSMMATPYSQQLNMDWMKNIPVSQQHVNTGHRTQNIPTSQIEGINENSKYVNYLNAIGKTESRKISELARDKKYNVKVFKKVNTQFGQRTVATLEENDKTFDVFLPERYNKLDTNYNVSGVSLIYKGLASTKNGNNYHKLEFSN